VKVTISKQILEKYPDFTVGVIFAQDVNNKGEVKEIIDLVREQQKQIKESLDLKKLAEYAFITNWRKTYSSFGAKPSSYLASSEALIRRILKDKTIPHINKIVDIYNYISIKYKTPVGGEDYDKLEGDLTLKFADGTEKFIPLGSQENQPPKKGEVVYSDNKEVVCRRWNWRESDKTKLTEDTNKFILVIDALPPVSRDVVEVALNETKSLLEKHCNVNCKTKILDKNDNEFGVV